MKNSSLFIDGENFKFLVEDILKKKNLGNKGLTFLDFNISRLFKNIIKDTELVEKNYYCAKLHYYEETAAKSKQLIDEQRRLKRNLTNSGFNFVISGNVRLQERVDRLLNKKYVFGEKGVDVRIAVDLVSYAYDRKVGRVYLCSSDSDLQPAIHKAKEKSLEIVYIGFEAGPNIGLTKTTDKTILLREAEVLECFDRLNPWNKV